MTPLGQEHHINCVAILLALFDQIRVVFTLGALAFFLGDWLVDQRGGAHRKAIGSGRAGESGAAIFLGTLLDNVPESTVLGMTFAFGGSVNIAFLVAVFVSNLPEGTT